MYTTLSAVFAWTLIAVSLQFLNAVPTPSVACEEQPKDLFLVVDGSASIGNTNFRAVRKFLEDLVSSVHISREMTHIGLLQFSNQKNVKIEFGLDKFYDTDSILKEIKLLKYQAGDSTRTDIAFAKVADKVFTGSRGDRLAVENVVVLFTDGNARKKMQTILNAEVLKQRGVKIIVIGAGGELPGFRDELEKIASRPEDVKVVEFAKLNDIVVDIVNKVCKLITTPVTTTLPPSTTLPPTTTQSPTTTTKPKTSNRIPTVGHDKENSACGDNPKDILFVVDGTANNHESVHRVNKQFLKIKKFIKKVVSKLSDKSTVGVLQYSEKGKVNMDVEFRSVGASPASIGKLKSLINDIKQQKGRARHTGEALVEANNKFYELDALRNHQQYPKVIVLVTRGEAWDRPITASESRMIQLRNIRLITVGVGVKPQRLETYLNAIASPRDALFYKYSKLKKESGDVVKKLCEVRRQPAEASTEEQCYRNATDIFFLVDGSASIKYTNFAKMRTFLMDFISLLRIESSDTNTGLMQFSESGQTSLIWELGETSERSALRNIQTMEYQAGTRTMTGDALSRINEIFNGHDGDRPDIDDILVVFTDGGAHDIPVVREMANSLKNRGVTVVAIGAGDSASLTEYRGELEEMASSPQHVLTVDFDELNIFAERAFPIICRYLNDIYERKTLNNVETPQ